VTDDTEMTFALAQAIVECGGMVDPEHCAKKYAYHACSEFDGKRFRGYGPAISTILYALFAGEVDWSCSGRMIMKDGSYGNGSLMRIVPVSLRLYAANDSELEEGIWAALVSTHAHSDAIWSSICWSRVVAALFKEGLVRLKEKETSLSFNTQKRSTMCKEIVNSVVQQWLVGQGRRAPERVRSRLFTTLDLGKNPRSSAQVIPNKELDLLIEPNQFGRYFAIHAADALSVALLLLFRLGEEPQACLCEAAAMGGDSDTIGCIVGGALGALHGTGWAPVSWLADLEDDPTGQWVGRTGLVQAADAIALLLLGERKE